MFEGSGVHFTKLIAQSANAPVGLLCCNLVSPKKLHPTLLPHTTIKYDQILQCTLCAVHQYDWHKSRGAKAARIKLMKLIPEGGNPHFKIIFDSLQLVSMLFISSLLQHDWYGYRVIR